jgi:hypothetical protein
LYIKWVQRQHVLKAYQPVLIRVHNAAEPKPTLFAPLVGFNDVQKELLSFMTLAGLCGLNPFFQPLCGLKVGILAH